MFKKISGILLVLVVVMPMTKLVFAADKAGNCRDRSLQVVTTLFPTYDFAQQIGKDKVDVNLLLPPGVEPHSFDPKPKDIVRISQADIFVYIGKYMEPWAEDIIKGVSHDELVVVDSSIGIDLIDEADQQTKSGDRGQAFEWAGVFKLSADEYTWTFSKVDGDYADPQMKMVILAGNANSLAAIEEGKKTAQRLMELSDSIEQVHGDVLTVNDRHAYQLIFDPERKVTEFRIVIKKEGAYTFFTEHMPFEFEADDHFFKNIHKQDIEPGAQKPDTGHHHHHGGKDPHIWLDLGHVQKMVETMAQAFAQKDPRHKDFYLANASEFNRKAADLDTRFRQMLSTAKHKSIIYGGHFAFGYFARRYGLTHESPYAGCSPNAEPSPKAIAELIAKLRASGQKYIYHEELIDPKVSRIIAEETGATLELLHGAHNVSKEELRTKVTFLDIMENNLQKLKAGLECQ